mmetsp:Transcript_14365/g.21913  ORF Transcript_14365/g.21913 Transcript_14365/m.21913 type:complete len:95 (+) Transcript_14365:146-430(+)
MIITTMTMTMRHHPLYDDNVWHKYIYVLATTATRTIDLTKYCYMFIVLEEEEEDDDDELLGCSSLRYHFLSICRTNAGTQTLFISLFYFFQGKG